MAAIGCVEVVFGARSVSVFVPGPVADGDTLSFAVVRDALLSAGAMRSSDIVEFLGTSHRDAVGTVRALTSSGAFIGPVAAEPEGRFDCAVVGDNLLRFSAARALCLRISLSSAAAS